jgi:predicted glycoside hydrolase/deacetylase ChbG (UPF0249 family)
MNTSAQAVICADDFAINDSVSTAIVSLAKAKKISATSVHSLSPLWKFHAPMLKAHHGTLDVGLHLDFTSEYAVQAGYGATLNSVLLRSTLRRFNQSNLEIIIESQLNDFESVWGSPPDHLDGHQHVHQFPVIRSALARVLKNRYGASKHKPWLRVSQVLPRNFKSSVITLSGAKAFSDKLLELDFPFTPVLLGVYNYDLNTADYRQSFKKWLQLVYSVQAKELKELNEQSEQGVRVLAALTTPQPFSIMCHPGAAASVDDVIGRARLAEFEYLSSNLLELDLQAAGVSVVRASEVFRNNFKTL